MTTTQNASDADVLAILRKHFAEVTGQWRLHYNGQNQHAGVEIIFPITIYVSLEDYGWRAEACEGEVFASRAEGWEAPDDVEEGSLEELDFILEAFRVNLAQSLEEMRRGLVASTGIVHTYIEPKGSGYLSDAVNKIAESEAALARQRLARIGGILERVEVGQHGAPLPEGQPRTGRFRWMVTVPDGYGMGETWGEAMASMISILHRAAKGKS
jgi:hypothetical protein